MSSYMQVAEWLLNISMNGAVGGTSATIGGWRGVKYGGNVVTMGWRIGGGRSFLLRRVGLNQNQTQNRSLRVPIRIRRSLGASLQLPRTSNSGQA